MSLKQRNERFFKESSFVDSLLDAAEMFLYKALGYPTNVFVLEKALAKKLELDPNYEVWVPLRYYRSATHTFENTPLFVQSSSFWISSLGKMYNTKRLVKNQQGSVNGSGYPTYCFTESGVEATFVIHRAIACSFVSPKGKFKGLPLVRLQVNHIDGDKLNRSLSNLEWCDSNHNVQHAVDTGLKVVGMGIDNHLTKPLLGEVAADCPHKGVKFILSGAAQAKKYKLGERYKVAHGEIPSYKGCSFSFASEEDLRIHPSIDQIDESVLKFIMNFDAKFKGYIIATEVSTGEQIKIKGVAQMNELGFKNGMVYACCAGKCKQYKGYTFEREA